MNVCDQRVSSRRTVEIEVVAPLARGVTAEEVVEGVLGMVYSVSVRRICSLGGTG